MAKRKGRRQKSNFNRRTGSGTGKAMPLPEKFRFQSRYMENNLSLDPGVASNNDHIFRLNSLYDPDVTYTGHQPLGYDQLSPLYTEYTVIGCRARVTLNNTDPHHPMNFYLFPSSTGQALVSDAQLTTMIERGKGRWCQVAPAGSGGNTKTLTLNWSAKEWFGKSPFDDDNCSAAMNSNPPNSAYLHIVAQPVGAGAENPLPLVGAAVLEYIAIMTEPKPMPQS
jgi:hypothetical protein